MTFDYREGLQRIWSETDSRGSWASGTASGPNTQRDHGQLIVPDASGTPRVLIHHFEEYLELDGQRWPLSSTVYRDVAGLGRVVVHPQGHLHLESFHAAPYPRWVYSIGATRVIRTLRPIGGEEGFALEYVLVAAMAGAAARLSLRPMISGRSVDTLQHETPWPTIASPVDDTLTVTLPDGAPSLHLRWSRSAAYEAGPTWYRHVRLVASGEDEEDIFSPGALLLPLNPDQPSGIKFTASETPPGPLMTNPIILREESRAPSSVAATLRRTVRWTGTDTAIFTTAGHSTAARSRAATTRAWAAKHPGKPVSCIEAVGSLALLAEHLETPLLAALVRGHAPFIANAPLDARLGWIGVLAELARRGAHNAAATQAALSQVDSLLNGGDPAAVPLDNLLLHVREPGQSWWDRVSRTKTGHREFPVDIQALWANALASCEILSAVRHPAKSSATTMAPASNPADATDITEAHRPYGKLFLIVADNIRRLYWNPDKLSLADNLVLDGLVTDDPHIKSATAPGHAAVEAPAPTMRRDLRITSAPLITLALRFEILPPSRGRAVLESARRLLSVESHGRSTSAVHGDTAILGFRASADSRTAYPWLLGPWYIAAARLNSPRIIAADTAPDTTSPQNRAAQIVSRHFTAHEIVHVPEGLDPLPPEPHAPPNAPNLFAAGRPHVLGLAALATACLTNAD